MSILNGNIISPKGNEFKKTGILVVRSRRVMATNTLSASVKYFSLDLDPKQEFEYVSDTDFVCPYNEFLNNFMVLDNIEDDEGRDRPVWISVEDFYNKEEEYE